MAKEIFVAYGVDVDAVAGWLGSYGGENSPDDISRGLFAGEVGTPRLLELFRRHGVQATFCGHWHRNHETRDGDMLEVLTSSVGYPLGDDPSGIRVVRLTAAGVEHEYRPLPLAGAAF